MNGVRVMLLFFAASGGQVQCLFLCNTCLSKYLYATLVKGSNSFLLYFIYKCSVRLLFWCLIIIMIIIMVIFKCYFSGELIALS